MNRFISHLSAAAFLALLSSAALAQVNAATPGWFPFNASGFDASPTVTDLSYLNTKPAGRDGFVGVQNGVFVDGAGSRLRFFGTNLVGESCFPSAADAPKIAKKLAKLGFNIVRLHHLDYTWGPGSLMNYPDNNAIRADNLDKMDFFVNELKKQGIYINLNLHVSRTYAGTPNGFDASKGLDHFYAPFITQFQQYAHDLLLHVNPYTGLSYAHDPAIAYVEVNNENTLGLYSPQTLATLPEPFYSSLRHLYTDWLRTKYTDTAGLRAVWGVNDGSVGANIVPNPNFANNAQGWSLENHNGAVSTLSLIPGGTPGVRWTATQAGTDTWHLQLNYPGLNVQEGKGYRLSFQARADAARSFSASVMLDQSPWSGVGLWASQNLTTAWQTFTYDFNASGTVPNHCRVNLSAENHTGIVDIANVELRSISTGALTPDQTFENDNLPFTYNSTNPVAVQDFSLFLNDTERTHAQQMHTYLKNDLGVLSLVTHSQAGFGGMTGAYREKTVSDLVDAHNYWQHPSFPGVAWDPNNWLIQNTSQLAVDWGGAVGSLALERVAGKPFTVSEYNTPAPSDYAAETWPLLAAMGGLQDWDGIYQFEYNSFNPNYDGNRIRGFFSQQGHPAHEVLQPLMALMFRKGMIAPAQQNITLTYGVENAVAFQRSWSMWGSFENMWGQAGVARTAGLKHRVSLNPQAGTAAPSASMIPTITMPFTSDTNQIVWNPTTAAYSVNAPNVRMLLGRIGATTTAVGDVQFQITSPAAGKHAHLALISLDNRPLMQSARLLLSAVGRAENQNMGWNANRTTVGNNWGTGPAVLQGVDGKLTLSGGRWRVSLLDPHGARLSSSNTITPEVTLAASNHTAWYLLEQLQPISGVITLQNSVNLAQTLTFEFRPTDGSASFSRTVTLSAAGTYAIADVPAGQYMLGVKGAKWLRKTVSLDTLSAAVSNLNLTLKAGDANNDNAADISDLLILIGAYNKQSGQAGFSDAADFTCDGANDIADLLILISNYNQRGDN